MTEELKPCPFCGGEPGMMQQTKVNWAVMCHVCGAEGGWSNPSDAIALWNRRATPLQAVPEGWRLVPLEPTKEMWEAVNKLDDAMAAGSYDGKGCSIEQAWECLLAAAPQPSQEPEHQHYWGYFTDTKTYRCRCGAETSQYPLGPAGYKD